MNRNIKFRVRLKNKKVMNPFLTFSKELHPKFLMTPPQDSDYILMQSIGEKDCNKKEIFEGDILKFTTRSQHRTVGTVDFTEGMFFVTGDDLNFDDICTHESEIMGNIYENPKLLQEIQEELQYE